MDAQAVTYRNAGGIKLALATTAVAMLAFRQLRVAFGSPFKPITYGGICERMQAILCAVPLLSACPRPPLDISGAVQIAIFALQMCWQELRCREQYVFDEEDVEVVLPGESSDGCHDNIVVSWLRTAKGDSDSQGGAPPELPADAPIILISPGLNCYASNLPGTSAYQGLLQRRWRVAVFQKRDGSSRRAWPPRALLSPFRPPVGPPHRDPSHPVALAQRPSAPVGFSSGNGLVGSYMALYGSETTAVRSALLLLGGENYNMAFVPPRGTLLTKLVFDWSLLSATKFRFLQRNEAVLRNHNMEAYDKALAAPTLQEFYDIAMKHFSGYKDHAEAERRINAFSTGNECMLNFQKPFLVAFTTDDPVAPGGPRESWVRVIEKCEYAALALFPSGSHLGCYDSLRLTRWVDKLMIQWLDAVTREGA
eukprot:CAMPEP_0117475334 /NCGR_PEP_ID=MMETSP0784-20121206/9741_1 /TAXON_ID=39447 /ORGANISM="" /LENGTH=422 /DNA_ID=CAMNT_0005269577 /DNA_START=98 /DNA_END=1367 /DNA_ORIENTATION=-